MLRITRTSNGEGFFRISGDLDAENVAEIEVVIAEEKEGSRITLDLTDLRSVDGDADASRKTNVNDCSPPAFSVNAAELTSGSGFVPASSGITTTLQGVPGGVSVAGTYKSTWPSPSVCFA